MRTEDLNAPPETDSPPVPPPSRGKRFLRWTVSLTAAAYLITILVLYGWMRLAGTDAWALTFLLYGPRWLLALPLAVLAPAALFFHRRALVPLAVAGLVLAGPILGFEPHFIGQEEPGDVRIMTCNVDDKNYDVAKLAQTIERERPDVVALQEAKQMPPEFVWPQGWHFVHSDELIVASRWPLRQIEIQSRPHIPTKPAAILVAVELPRGELRLVTLHLLTPRPGLEAVLNSRTGIDLSRVDELQQTLAAQAEDSAAVSAFVQRIADPKIICGDFNLPIESPLYRRDWSQPRNAFSTAGLGFGFSKLTEEEGWIYGTRIDHFLYTPPWRCVRAWLAEEIGSDHRPLVADFVLD